MYAQVLCLHTHTTFISRAGKVDCGVLFGMKGAYDKVLSIAYICLSKTQIRTVLVEHSADRGYHWCRSMVLSGPK